QAGRKDDSPLLPSFPLEPSTASAEPAGLQPGQFVAAPGVAQANRELVADQLAAAAGEDGRTAGETCPLLLAVVGGEPSDETVVWRYAPADRSAVASGGIAEVVAGKSIQSQEGTEVCLTKPDGRPRPALAKRALGHTGPCAAPPGSIQRKKRRWNPSMGIQCGAVGS